MLSALKLVTLITLGVFVCEAEAKTKGAFVHYMVGGLTQDQAYTDVDNAIAMGVDAFALNVMNTDHYTHTYVEYLFKAAADRGFKIFFSWDMHRLGSPSDTIDLMTTYAKNDAYYYHEGTPVSSTFYGGKISNSQWQRDYIDKLGEAGIETYFIPSFDDVDVQESFFETYPVASGTMCWECAWSEVSHKEGFVGEVGTSQDEVFMSQTTDNDKSYMMAMSPIQYKHMKDGGNWYRAGGDNLGLRMEQALEKQPDFVEIISWNDAGEGHYIGDIWPYTVDTSPEIQAYTDGMPHYGFRNALAPFVAGIKDGAETLTSLRPQNDNGVQGAFWYQTLLNAGDCSMDKLGKPDGYQAATDVVNVIVTLAESGATVTVYSGGEVIGSESATQGLNHWSFEGLRVGEVHVDVTTNDGSFLASTTGEAQVSDSMDLCNYNVVAYNLG